MPRSPIVLTITCLQGSVRRIAKSSTVEAFEQYSNEQWSHDIRQQVTGEQATGEQATGEQETSEQATGAAENQW